MATDLCVGVCVRVRACVCVRVRVRARARVRVRIPGRAACATNWWDKKRSDVTAYVVLLT